MTNKLLALIIALQIVIICLVLAGRPPTLEDFRAAGWNMEERSKLAQRMLVCRSMGGS